MVTRNDVAVLLLLLPVLVLPMGGIILGNILPGRKLNKGLSNLS